MQKNFLLFICFCIKLTKAEKEFDIDLRKKFEIKDTKPGLLSVYDYYEPMGKLKKRLFKVKKKKPNFLIDSILKDDAFVQQFEISNDCN